MAFNIFKKKSVTPDVPVPKDQGIQPVQVSSDVQLRDMHVPARLAGRQAHTTLKHFFISEKGTRLGSQNQFLFKVRSDATKSEIAKEVSVRYSVKVIAVRTVTIPSKRRMVGGHAGRKAGFKKAIVVLKEGDTIAQAQP